MKLYENIAMKSVSACVRACVCAFVRKEGKKTTPKWCINQNKTIRFETDD